MEHRLIHRKETLIVTAIEIINEFGFQGLTTKEIARRENISEATIFKHFKNKNGLILGVLDHFSQYDSAIIQSVENRNLTPGEALFRFIESYVSYYENYPEITAILHTFDSLVMQPEFRTKIEEILANRTNFIINLLDQAQNLGMLHPWINTESLAHVIMGTEREINLKWRISNNSFSLKEQTLATLKMLLDAFDLEC